jgi:hypothetical protein
MKRLVVRGVLVGSLIDVTIQSQSAAGPRPSRKDAGARAGGRQADGKGGKFAYLEPLEPTRRSRIDHVCGRRSQREPL